MKRIISSAAILLLTVAFIGCVTEEAPQPTNETSITELEVNEVAFGIEGMT